MLTTFAIIKQLALDAVGHAPFVGANYILSDGVTKEAVLARIAALRPGYPLEETVARLSSITGEVIEASDVDRQLVIPTDPPTGENRIIFASWPALTTPPLRIKGWLLSPDSTILPEEMEVHYRTPGLTPASPWKKLSQQDGVCLEAGVQFSILLPAPPLSERVLRTLHILADQI